MSSTQANISGSASGCTEVMTEHFTYEWVIKKFKHLPQENGERIYSPEFSTNTNEARWKLGLCPNGNKKDDAGNVSICLCLVSQKNATAKIQVQIEFSIPQIQVTYTMSHTFLGRTAVGYGQITSRSKVLESCGSDDTLTIICRMDIPRDTITESRTTTDRTIQAFNLQEGQLNQAFRLLYKEPKLSDVTVIVGTRRFPAHKLVLATRSPVFSAMFENKETQENLTNEVKIEEMEPEVVEAMLEFFYTDEVTNLEELAVGLLEAADKYDIQRLRNMCEKVLYETLNKENAAEILVRADLHRSHELKKLVMEFMEDHLLDVVETESYKEIEDLGLLKEFIRSIGVRKASRK